MKYILIVGMLILAVAGVGTLALAHGQKSVHSRFVYLAGGQGCSLVFQFRVGADGRRRALSPPSVTVDGSAYLVVVAPNGKSVYVPEGDYMNVAQFHVRRNGTLTPMRQAQVVADSHPASLVFDPSRRHVYVSCSHGDICQYRARRDGSLVPLRPRAVYIAAGGVRDPTPVAFSHGGHLASVVAVRDDGVSAESIQFRFRVNCDGALALLSRRSLKSPTMPKPL